MHCRWSACLVALLAISASAQNCPASPRLKGQDALDVVCASGGVAYSSPACSIWRLCHDTTLDPPMYQSMCDSSRLAATLCLDDDDVVSQVPSCASFAAQRDTVLTDACKKELGYFSIYSTWSTSQAAGMNCGMMSGMAGCDLCPDANNCKDPLVALGVGCAEMRMSGCFSRPSILDFCAQDAAGPQGDWGYAAPWVCFLPKQAMKVPRPPAPSPLPSPVPSPVPSPQPSPVPPSPRPSPQPSPVPSPHPSSRPVVASAPQAQPSPVPSPTPPAVPAPMPTAPVVADAAPAVVPPVTATPTPVTTTPTPVTSSSTPAPAGSQLSCVTTPTADACAAYTYPDANIVQDIQSMCSAMSDMPGCTIWTACQSGAATNQQLCDPLTVLATLCTDMPMSGCLNFNSMCAAGSKVPQCAKVGKGIASAPTWKATRNAIFDICGTHFMSQCSQCTKRNCPDPLSTLAAMCGDMPSMPECGLMDSFCSSVAAAGGGLPTLCSDGGEGVALDGSPSMLMYFHQRWNEYILWKTWVPTTRGEYAGAVICTLAFGIVSMVLKTWITCLTIKWRVSTPVDVSGRSWLLPSSSQVAQGLAKASISAIAICLDYFNMLIAMTYNVGLFVAVVMGYALGAALVSYIPDNYAAHLADLQQAQEQCDAKATLCCDTEQGKQKGGRPIAESVVGMDGGCASHACCPGPCS